MTELFYDSTQPEKIPAGADALLYGDGDYKATAEQAKRFTAVRWITVLGSPECGAADYESGNKVFGPGKLRAWAIARRAMGCRARVYTDLANLAAARAEVGGLPNVVWWLATLDGDKLSAGYEGLPVWAVQYEGGETAPYDTSVLYGEW
jgi:hypothetical protein